LGQDIGKLFDLSEKAREKGNFLQAEEYLLRILQNKKNIEAENLVVIYNELGIISKITGYYDKAIEYYTQCEKIILSNRNLLRYQLPSIYTNIGNIYQYKGDYKKALEYFNESVNNENLNKLDKKERMKILSFSYNNIGIMYFTMENFKEAVYYFKESIKIKSLYKLEGIEESYYNYANCLRELKEYKQAEINYQKCIDARIVNYGENSYRLANVYKSMGLLKMMMNDASASLKLYKKALEIYLSGYGRNHPSTADMYLVLGDFYMKQKNCLKALEYYQQSLSANSIGFKSSNIYQNPVEKNCLSEIQLLETLKKKASAFSQLYANEADKSKKKNMITACMETLDLATVTLKKLRKGYLSYESKLYITQNEKEIYLWGIENALQLYELTRDKSYIEKAYQFSRESKAAVLEDEINRNETFASFLPDSLKKRKTEIQQNILTHEKLIYDEHEKVKPSQEKITHWQSELFKLNQEFEKLLAAVKSGFPDCSLILSKKEIHSLTLIQKGLRLGETLVEYSYSLSNNTGQLYTFVIDSRNIKYYRLAIDSTFEQKIICCHNWMNHSNSLVLSLKDYNNYNFKLYQLYRQLIEPLHLEKERDIIIVPDEKIAYISFDALISYYKKDSVINYAALPYLLFDYRFSYAYSSNLLFRKTQSPGYTSRVYAFAPDYGQGYVSDVRRGLGELKNAKKEISSIYKVFEGEPFIGKSATINNFKTSLKNRGIYHLAMHTLPVDSNSDYSCLVFGSPTDGDPNKYLYNYEIGNLPMKASLLVLSACNTGNGEVYRGEGVMSMSRSFLLAGVQSVVHGLWKINDESSSIIMESFYKYLSEGKSKSEALQLAKINYIENTSPELAQPKYWAGLVLMGNNAPVINSPALYIIIPAILTLLILSFVLFLLHKKANRV
jgi:CHAT domain-containing protein